MESPFDADCGMCAMEVSHRLRSAGHFAESLSFRMYICDECGNKRCAKAQDHTEACDEGAATIERNRRRALEPRKTVAEMLAILDAEVDSNV